MIKETTKPLILVAEDDDITRVITVKTLERKGYRVISAINGRLAVESCYSDYPQIILMDGSMPELDGFDACRQIKQSQDKKIRAIPIIMVTALSDDDAIDRAFQAGAEDYITKPVNWHLLEHRLNILIQKIQAEKSLQENEARFHAIAESANDAIISINQQGNIIFWNQAASQIFGYSEAEILGKDLTPLIPENYREKHQLSFKKANQSKIDSLHKGTRQLHGCKKDGSIFPLELTLSGWTVNSQRYYSCILRDISDRLKQQKELAKLSTAVKQSPNLVIMTDLNGIVEYANPQVKKITGYEYEDIIGKNINILRSKKTAPLIYQDLWQTIKRGETWSGTLENKKKNADFYWAKESISPILDESGLISHFIAIQEDITKAKALSEEISYRATHDPLTGLINRHAFETHMSKLLAGTGDMDRHALCFIDLDRFKIVNDTAGHLAGDELLRQLGKQMKRVLRKQDVLARLGGDEFALVLSDCQPDHSLVIAKKLQQLISKYQFSWDNDTFTVGASIGLVSIKKGDAAREVLKLADTACYAAKNTGRNKVYVFSEDDKYLTEQSGESQWIARIEQALEKDQFCLYTQAIMDLTSVSSGHKYEILLRLIDEDQSVILPEVFLPAAERFNLASKIDAWVIEQTLSWFNQHQKILNSLDYLSINLSGQSFIDETIQTHIIKLVKQLQFPTHKLVFEITETAAINNLTQAKSFITTLQQMGIRFALDDFGSGLSSFAYLKNLPVEFIKIDGLFIKDIVSNPVDRAMVKSIHQIAKIIGKETIAEFVENQEIIDTLNEIGIHYTQGFHCSKPMPLDELFETK